MPPAETVETRQRTRREDLAPSGGDLKSKLLRVSHMGDQTEEDVELLVNDLKNTISTMKEKGGFQ